MQLASLALETCLSIHYLVVMLFALSVYAILGVPDPRHCSISEAALYMLIAGGDR